jgi:hypothetical protein
MKTKLKPCKWHLPLFRIFSTILLASTSIFGSGQVLSGLETTSLARAGSRLLLANVWSVSNNPAKMPKKDNNVGFSWTGISTTTGLQFTSFAYQRLLKKTGIGFQWKRMGYEVSAFNSAHINLSKQWNSNTSTGLTYNSYWWKVLGREKRYKYINVSIGVVSRIKDVDFSMVLENFVPRRNNTETYNTLIHLGIRQNITDKTTLYVENSIEINGKFSPRIALQYETQTRVNCMFGIGLNPVKFAFGIGVKTRHNLRLTTASSFQNRMGWQPSASIEMNK